MKKLIFVLICSFSLAGAANLKLTTNVSGSVDKFGASELPALLFKFDFPAELQKARIDLVYLRFNIEADTAKKGAGLLVRPMLENWVSGQKFSALSDSSASAYHVNFGRASLKTGIAEIEVTQLLKAWQAGELPNVGLLVYPAAGKANALALRNLPTGGVAELEIFYTPEEKPDTALQQK